MKASVAGPTPMRFREKTLDTALGNPFMGWQLRLKWLSSSWLGSVRLGCVDTLGDDLVWEGRSVTGVRKIVAVFVTSADLGSDTELRRPSSRMVTVVPTSTGS